MKKLKKWFRNHGNVVAFVGGGALVVGTFILSNKATAKSVLDIANTEATLGYGLSAKEKIKLCWRNYLPAAFLLFGGVATVATGGILTAAKTAAVNEVAARSQEVIRDLQASPAPIFTSAEPVSVRKEDIPKACPVNYDYSREPLSGEVVYTFYDSLSDSEFESTPDEVMLAQDRLNRSILDDSTPVTLADFVLEASNSEVKPNGLSSRFEWRAPHKIDIMLAPFFDAEEDNKLKVSIIHVSEPTWYKED